MEKGLGYLFITSSSSHFFNKTHFEQLSPSMDSVVYWKEDSSFQQISQFVSELKVINDTAERSVEFGSVYNQILTKEPRRQSILQVVQQTRKTFATSKQTFSKTIEFFLISL